MCIRTYAFEDVLGGTEDVISEINLRMLSASDWRTTLIDDDSEYFEDVRGMTCQKSSMHVQKREGVYTHTSQEPLTVCSPCGIVRRKP